MSSIYPREGSLAGGTMFVVYGRGESTQESK